MLFIQPSSALRDSASLELAWEHGAPSGWGCTGSMGLIPRPNIGPREEVCPCWVSGYISQSLHVSSAAKIANFEAVQPGGVPSQSCCTGETIRLLPEAPWALRSPNRPCCCSTCSSVVTTSLSTIPERWGRFSLEFGMQLSASLMTLDMEKQGNVFLGTGLEAEINLQPLLILF